MWKKLHSLKAEDYVYYIWRTFWGLKPGRQPLRQFWGGRVDGSFAIKPGSWVAGCVSSHSDRCSLVGWRGAQLWAPENQHQGSASSHGGVWRGGLAGTCPLGPVRDSALVALAVGCVISGLLLQWRESFHRSVRLCFLLILYMCV